MNDVEKLLARSQFKITIIVLLGYFGVLIGVGLKWLDVAIARELGPLVAVIVFFWFQRQRPHSADDPPDVNAEPPPVASIPTQPPPAAK